MKGRIKRNVLFFLAAPFWAGCRFIRNSLILLLAVIVLTCPLGANAQEKKLIRGYDGGMMIHTGYLAGTVSPDEIAAKGMPTGIGGVIHLHLGNHLRVGSEGYVSTLNQRGNGSYIKYGWGGLLLDVYTVVGRFQPFAGLTVGGGAATTLLLSETPATAWARIDGTLYNKQGFMALAPFVGCDFIAGRAMHLTLKADWLNCMGNGVSLPSGPRIYFGFLFYH